MATGEDASAQCPFCQNTMIDAEFAGNDVPEVIIPFKLNKEEALESCRGGRQPGNSGREQATESTETHF